MNVGDCPFGQNLQHYWDRRHALFTKWDLGVRVDEEGLFSLQPEAIRLGIARLLRGRHILDPFCGVGGIAIACACLGHRVTTVDTSRTRLEMAVENASIYGVRDQIEFVHDEATQAMRRTKADSVILDPPWGGPGYRDRSTFSLDDFVPSGESLIRLGLQSAAEVTICLPCNFNTRDLDRIGAAYELATWVERERVMCLTGSFRRTEQRGK